MAQVVVAQEGFAFVNERPGAVLLNEKWGWISDKPGSWAELEFDSTTAVQGPLSTDTNEVLVAFLKSYEKMGQARVECVAGCT
jgi:hypothetical protein